MSAFAKSGGKVIADTAVDLASESAFSSAIVGDAVKPQVVTAIESKNERKITKEVISLVANAAAALVAGPAAAVIFIASVAGMLLDMYWNPLQTYFNDDLKEFKKIYEDSLISMMKAEGYNWPLEVKPVVMPTTDEEVNEFNNYINEYYKERGIISKDEALDYIEFTKDISALNRLSSTMFLLPDGSVDKNALYSTFQYIKEGENLEEKKLLIDIAKVLVKKRSQKRLNKLLLQKEQSNSFIEFSKKNWQIYIIILICISLIIFSCSILITSTKSNE